MEKDFVTSWQLVLDEVTHSDCQLGHFYLGFQADLRYRTPHKHSSVICGCNWLGMVASYQGTPAAMPTYWLLRTGNGADCWLNLKASIFGKVVFLPLVIQRH